MNKGVSSLFIALLLVGQGCLAPATSIPLEEIDSITTEETPDGSAAFTNGFGTLPGPAPTAPVAKERQPSIVLNAELPVIPPEVTVLREWKTTPNTQLLRNITTAVEIPAGAFGNSPQGEALTIAWRSTDGYRWTYEAPLHALTFAHPNPPTTATTNVSVEQIVATARTFLTTHGIETAGWGQPEVFPATTGSWRVSFSASRDVQPATTGDGAFLRAGELTGFGDMITKGTLELPRSLDRSNYPAFTQGELLQRLRVGGTNPVVNASSDAVITYSEFFLVAYRHTNASNTQSRTFFLPALYAKGLLRQGASTIPHATVVPLVHDAFFEKTTK